MRGRRRWGGDILKADMRAIHDTIGHVFAISGAMIFSGCAGTRVALVRYIWARSLPPCHFSSIPNTYLILHIEA